MCAPDSPIPEMILPDFSSPRLASLRVNFPPGVVPPPFVSCNLPPFHLTNIGVIISFLRSSTPHPFPFSSAVLSASQEAGRLTNQSHVSFIRNAGQFSPPSLSIRFKSTRITRLKWPQSCWTFPSRINKSGTVQVIR